MNPRRVAVFCVGAGYDGWRLDHFLKGQIPALSRRRIQQAIGERIALVRAGDLRREGGIEPSPTLSLPIDALPGWLERASAAVRASTCVRAGDRVAVWPEVPRENQEEWEVPILYRDEHLLAVDKPAGLVVHSTRGRLRNTLLAIVQRREEGGGDERTEAERSPLALVHRLDRETSGVLLLSRSRRAAQALAASFACGRVRKTYRAIVRGAPDPPAGRIDLPIGHDPTSGIHVRRAVSDAGAAAVTDYATERVAGGFALLRLQPLSGRRHQIRVHLEAIGHPIVGDKLYGGDPRWYLRGLERGESEAMRRALLAPRQLLHAAALELVHPLQGGVLRIESPLPADMREFLADPPAGSTQRRSSTPATTALQGQ
jgi:23S rRNA pseudouridine1911/1915/1917 synthase